MESMFALSVRHTRTQYFNCKSYCNILLPEQADAAFEFTTIDVGVYGMQSVGGTFRNSRVFQMIKNGELQHPT